MLIKENEYVVYMTKGNQDYSFDINGEEKKKKKFMQLKEIIKSGIMVVHILEELKLIY